VAHEINNPLAGIRTYARLLRRQLAGAAEKPPSGEQLQETDRVLAMVDSEAGRCGDIVRNLLAFSRQSGARFAEDDLAPVVERCRLLLRHQAEMLNVTLEAQSDPDLPRVVCDAAQVQQVILALAMNALEATPRDGRVSVRACRDGEGVRIVVADTGAGIPAEHLDRIFEPFFTTKEVGKGVGLGLAVVYGIVNRHHGTIDVASEPGHGTTITVRLPARPPAEAGTKGDSEAGAAEPPAAAARAGEN
jgi:two-component system NtrC family sensor kinase